MRLVGVSRAYVCGAVRTPECPFRVTNESGISTDLTSLGETPTASISRSRATARAHCWPLPQAEIAALKLLTVGGIPSARISSRRDSAMFHCPCWAQASIAAVKLTSSPRMPRDRICAKHIVTNSVFYFCVRPRQEGRAGRTCRSQALIWYYLCLHYSRRQQHIGHEQGRTGIVTVVRQSSPHTADSKVHPVDQRRRPSADNVYHKAYVATGLLLQSKYAPCKTNTKQVLRVLTLP